MKRLILIAIVAVIVSSFAQPVLAGGVPQIGNDCPSGYRRDAGSGYCIAWNPQNAHHVVPQVGNDCPSGYRRDGGSGYCIAWDNPPKKRVIPQVGNDCPSGYRRDGGSGYCVSW